MGKLLKRLLDLDNYFPTRSTHLSEIKSLISKLHPVDCGIPLIRVGPSNDGGYLLPDDLGLINSCFSPGVCKESRFEMECAELGIPVFMADHSVNIPSLSHEKFHFTKKYIGAISNDKFMTINEWIYRYSKPRDDILIQMDIEGFEYEVLLSMDQNILSNCRVLLVEFHNLDQLWNRIFFKIISAVFEKILQSHSVVHIHPNNCCSVDLHKGIEIPSVMEFTFYNKKLFTEKHKKVELPHKLDQDNVTNKPSIKLSSDWFS